MQPISLPRVQQVPQQVTTAQGTWGTVALSDLQPSLNEASFPLVAVPWSLVSSVLDQKVLSEAMFKKKKKKNLLLQRVCNRPRTLTIFHSSRNSAFGVQASTSLEHWGTEVDTQTEKPSVWVEGTWNLLGKQVPYPQTNAMTRKCFL